jgi:hypothetical protein
MDGKRRGPSCCPAPLPISAEVGAGLVAHRQCHDPVNLFPVRHPLVGLAPCRLFGEADQVGAGDMVMVSNLASAHPAKEALGSVCVDRLIATEAVRLLMVDPVRFELGVQVIP